MDHRPGSAGKSCGYTTPAPEPYETAAKAYFRSPSAETAAAYREQHERMIERQRLRMSMPQKILSQASMFKEED